MCDRQSDAFMDQLKRQARFWKFLAIGTFAVLALAVACLTTFGVAQAGRQRAAAEASRIEAEEAHQKAEAAKRKAEQAAAESRRKAEQILYAGNIQQAQTALEVVRSVASSPQE